MNHQTVVERRITLRLLAYWERLRGGRAMPTEQDIDPDDIADLWDECFLIHTQDLNKPDYGYTYLGDRIRAAYDGGLSEKDPVLLLSPNAAHMSESYQKVLASGKPLIDEGEFTNIRGQVIKYRQCMLPLGEGSKIQAIFGGMRYKIA